MIDNIYILIFYSVTAIFLVIIFFLFLHIKNQNTIWKQRKAFQENEIIQQKQLLNAIIESQENERKRIGEDLHDEIGGTLSAIKLMLNTKRNEKTNEESLSSARQLIDKMIVNIRNISHDLSPPGLKLFGLYHTIDTFISVLNETGSVRIHLSQKPPASPVKLSERVELALFRVITQLISNTLKHAEASEVNLIFNYTGNELALTYYDNGKGFDVELLSKPHGMGMQNIKSRLQMIDAVYHIETGTGKGFKITINTNY